MRLRGGSFDPTRPDARISATFTGSIPGAAQHGVMRCRTGTVRSRDTLVAWLPDQRCTASPTLALHRIRIRGPSHRCRVKGARQLSGLDHYAPNRDDTASTTARSGDEVALIQDTTSHYAPVLIAPLAIQIRPGVRPNFSAVRSSPIRLRGSGGCRPSPSQRRRPCSRGCGRGSASSAGSRA
jgi:hypothetical protein